MENNSCMYICIAVQLDTLLLQWNI